MPAPFSPDDLPPLSSTGTPLPGRSDETESTPLPNSFGPYRILRILGEGGMGVVYLAEQDKPRRQVALKVLKPGTATPERLRRFEHEAEVLGRLQHPNTALIFEAGTADAGHGPQPFFALELVEGQALTVYAREHRLGNRQRLALMVQVCQAVQHAHQKGVIHRDLKPANILVGADGRPRVLDFGVARLTGVEVQTTTLGTGVGQLIGTIPYMSPEQAAADPDAVDTRSDVYTLGVLLYQLLARRLPHDLEGKSPLEAARTIREDDPTPLSANDRTLRGDLETIVATALEKDKERRYQSASALADDLERYLADQPIVARPASTWYQVRRFARRNKTLVGGVMGVFLALLLGVVGTTWWATRAVRAEKDMRQLLAKSHAQTAELAVRRGQWRQALASYDQALAIGHPDSVRLQVKKARAYLAVNDAQGFDATIQALIARTDLREQEGAVLLLRGDVALGVDNPAALDLIAQARRKGLPEADDLYAQALLANTSPEAVACFERSLGQYPYNARAQSMLAVTLLLLGRFPECRSRLTVAEALFPDDPNPKLLHALLEALEGDLPKARVALAGTRDTFGEKHLALFDKALMTLAAMRGEGNLDYDAVLALFSRLLLEVVPQLQQVWQAPADDEVGAVAAINLLPLPPVLATCFGHVQAALLPLVADRMDEKTDEKMAEELARAVAIHPEGTLQYMVAMVHFGRKVPGGVEGWVKKYVPAEAAAVKAAELPSLLPIRRGALYLAATCQGFLGSPRRTKPDLEMRLRAVGSVHRMTSLGPIQPLEFEILTKAASNADDLTLARTLLDGWEAINPTHGEALRLRYEVEMKAKNYGGAVETAEQAKQLFPDDKMWPRRHKDALDKLRAQLKAAEASPD